MKDKEKIQMKRDEPLKVQSACSKKKIGKKRKLELFLENKIKSETNLKFVWYNEIRSEPTS